MKKNILHLTRPYFYLLLTTCCLLFTVHSASAAVLSLSPSTGDFLVGGTMDVSVLLDSEGAAVNAIQVMLRFPADRLQLISPATGNSIISLWTAQPKFNNEKGIVEMQGVTPGGINVSRGLVTKLRFRVRAPGDAFVKFVDENNTRVLLHDGTGTDVLHNTQNAVFTLRLPPPLGPIVASATHPDQTVWYGAKTALLQWTPTIPDIIGFSYMLNAEPMDAPDDISEGTKQSVMYRNLADGTHYFHVKSLQGTSWGGTTNFALNVDTTPPAKFPLEVLPEPRTSSRKPVLQFLTTDALSGISRYELKTVSLSLGAAQNQPFFIEVQSPFVFPKLDLGRYDVIVRAYDNAGNYREETKRVSIVASAFRYFDAQGVYFFGEHFPWWLLILLLLILILALLLLARTVKRWRKRMEDRHAAKETPDAIKEKFRELEKYHKKYGKLAVLILFTLGSFGGLLGQPLEAFAEENAHADFSGFSQEMLDPPLFESVSREITNEDIFYAGGKTSAANVDVILYIQSTRNGEVVSVKTLSDSRGEWFYRHNTFLSPGTYTLWAQAKLGAAVSPPSSERSVYVRETVLVLGSSRFSYDFLYLALIFALSLAVIALVISILVHWHRGKRRHRLWMREVREAEDAVRRGFARLRHDIEVEIGALKKLRDAEDGKDLKELSAEEELREKELLSDLARIEEMIGKEVLDIERVIR